jgi:hypothetical protein
METEYKLYITNPKYFNSNQSNFEKNLSGKVVVKETLLSTGFTEKSTVGYVFGIPIPFVNPQTNANVPENNGSMILHGEASLFSPAKVLLNEMIAIITDTFFIKYGVNIDFSLDTPEEIKTTADKNEEEKNTINEKSADTSTISGATGTSIAGTNGTSGFKFNFDKDLGKKVLIGAGVLAGAGALALGIKALAGMTMSKNKDKPSIAPIEDNKIKGIKILVPSQYIDVYEISKYGGAPALVTTKESKQMVWIDKDYDRPEFMPSNLTSPLKLNDDLTGDFKINIQLGYPGGKKVGNWSEDGSQVFSTPDDLNDFFKLCEAHKEKHGNKLTYTLSTKKDWDEAQKNVQTNQATPPEAITPTPPAVEDSKKTTQPTESIYIDYLGEFDTIQGDDYSYYNLRQLNGKFKVLRIVDPNFNFNNVGMAQFKNTKGELVTFSCQAGSGPKTCDVNGASTGTYTLNVDSYPKGPLNSNKTEIKSKEFTQ